MPSYDAQKEAGPTNWPTPAHITALNGHDSDVYYKAHQWVTRIEDINAGIEGYKGNGKVGAKDRWPRIKDQYISMYGSVDIHKEKSFSSSHSREKRTLYTLIALNSKNLTDGTIGKGLDGSYDS